MWWLRSILPALLLLAACGFEPLYGDQRAADAQWLASIQVHQDKQRLSQLLSTSIEDAINPKGMRVAPQFRLTPQIETTEYPFATDLDGSVSRFVVDVRSSYTLVRLVDNKQIDTGHIKRTASYNVSDNDDYATYIAKRDAQERLMQEVAELYRLKLRAYFHRFANGHTAP